jgi:transposase-like protein
MKEDNVTHAKNPEVFQHDLLTQVLRDGAQRLLATAVEAEVDHFLAAQNTSLPDNDKPRFVRNGYLPTRTIMTGIGALPITVPRVRDRAYEKDGITFGSSIIPKYLRRTGDLNELLPLLYLKGLSTGDFVDALTPLVGEQAKTLSPGVIIRLKRQWESEQDTWMAVRSGTCSESQHPY